MPLSVPLLKANQSFAIVSSLDSSLAIRLRVVHIGTLVCVSISPISSYSVRTFFRCRHCACRLILIHSRIRGGASFQLPDACSHVNGEQIPAIA